MPTIRVRPQVLAIRLTLASALVVLSLAGAGSESPSFSTGQEPSPTQLAAGSGIEREIGGPERHPYAVSIAPGEAAEITVEQRGIDVEVRVLDQSGRLVLYVDDELRRTLTERLVLAPEAAAEYIVRIRARYATDPGGAYRISLEQRPAEANDRAAFDSRRLWVDSVGAEGKSAAEALQLVTRALALAEGVSVPDQRWVAELLTRAGDLNATLGNREEAQRLLERAISLAENALGRDDPRATLSRVRLGVFHINGDDLVRAEPLLAEAVAATERVLGAGHPLVATHLLSLARLHTLKRDFDSALAALQKGMQIAEGRIDPRELTFIALLNDLGDTYIQKDEAEKAEPYAARALDLMEKRFGADHIRVADPLANLGIIAREKREFELALQRLERAHAIRSKVFGEKNATTAGTLISIGNVHHAKGDYDQAIDTFQRALDVLEVTAGPYHSLTMMALSNMARSSAARGEIEEAVAYQVRVEQIVEKNIGLNLRIGSERQKLAYFDAQRRRTWRTVSLHNQFAPDDSAATLLAAEVVLQRKGRVLDAMASASSSIREQLDAESRELFDQLQATTSRVAALALNGPGRTPFAEYTRELRTLEQRQETLEAEISRRSGAFRAAAQPLTLAAVQRAIPKDAALVEFIAYKTFSPNATEDRLAYGEPRYAAYIIRPGGSPLCADLGAAAPIDAAVARLRDSLRDPGRRDVKERSRALDALVFEPIRAQVGETARLLLSPDGELNLVPFEALVDRRGRYAIESYAIGYLTSGRDLLRLQVPRESRSAPLVLANPDFGEPPASASAIDRSGNRRQKSAVTSARDLASTYFAPLSGTAQEARLIQSLFPQATVLTREKATKAALRAAEAPAILHIASHGFFLEDTAPPASAGNTRAVAAASAVLENPLIRSGMALAQANARRGPSSSGILTALEASALNLWGTELVTLSACDTGVGEVRLSEGVYGLRRAFLLAGAESVVMSLWPVSDAVTRRMMTSYYTGLKQGLGRGEALRSAQLTMLKRRDLQHPYYWAGFIQAGAWTPLRMEDGRWKMENGKW